MNKKVVEDYLNDLNVPIDDKKSNGVEFPIIVNMVHGFVKN